MENVGTYNKKKISRTTLMLSLAFMGESVISMSRGKGNFSYNLEEGIVKFYDSKEMTKEEGNDCFLNYSEMRKYYPIEEAIIERSIVRINRGISTARTYWDKYVKNYVIEYNPDFVLSFSKIQEWDIEKAMCFIMAHEASHIIRSHTVIYNEMFKKVNKTFLNLMMDLSINRELMRKSDEDLKVGINDHFSLCLRAIKDFEIKEFINDYIKIVLNYKSGKAKVKFEREFKKGEKVDIVVFGNFIDEKDGIESLWSLFSKYFKIEDNENDNSKVLTVFIDPEEEDKEEALSKVYEVLTDIAGSSGFSNGNIHDIVGRIKIPLNLNNPRVNWKSVLKREITKGMDVREVYNSEIPSARIEMQFGREEDKPKLSKVLLAIDMSGSISIDDYLEIISEINSIIKNIGRRVELKVVWWGSTKVIEKYKNCKKFIERCKLEVPSLGGTNVNLAIDEINKTKADLNLIFTDGRIGSDIKDTNKRIIWCVTSRGEINKIPKNSRFSIVKVK